MSEASLYPARGKATLDARTGVSSVYRTWAVTGLSIMASALLGGVGHVQRSSPPQNTVSRTAFPPAVATTLSWIHQHESAQSGLPAPAGPQWLPPAPSGGYQIHTWLTRNGYAIALRVAASAEHSATYQAGEAIAWRVNGDEGAGANLGPYMKLNNPYWRRPVGTATAIPLGAKVVGYQYRVSTAEAVGGRVRPISIATWTVGHWTLEVRGGTRTQQAAGARRLVGFMTSHRLPVTPAGVIVVKMSSSAPGQAATTQADWMATSGVGWTQFSDTVPMPMNPLDTCHMLTTWRTSPFVPRG